MTTAAPETVLQTRPNYSPTSHELTNAVAAILKKEPSPVAPSVKDVLVELQKEHPTWKLPERRVAKFVKKQSKTTTNAVKAEDTRTHDSDNDSGETTQSSMAKRMAKSISKSKFGVVGGGLFKRGKKKEEQTQAQGKNPPSQILTEPTTPDTTSLVSPISSVGAGEDANDVQSPPLVDNAMVEETTQKTTAPDAARNLEAVYEDDNDGSKEEPCCGACVIS